MKDACTKNGKKLDPARYGEMKFNRNKLCGEAMHCLDEQYSETHTTEIDRLYELQLREFRF